MKTPLVEITILSIYKLHGRRVMLPKRMAVCTPDMHGSINRLSAALKEFNGQLILSDLFRSYDMQLQAHLDYSTRKKKAFSPPPGGSMHEGGRAFDLSLKDLKIPLKQFWDVASKYGVVPIITSPDPREKEAWHFECRGSHQQVYDYYKQGKGHNMKPYGAMAASSILAIGVKVNRFGENQKGAYLQSCLIRLGSELGNVDGYVGNKTKDAILKTGINMTDDIDELISQIEDLLQKKYPEEFAVRHLDDDGLFDFDVSNHLRL